MKDISYERSTKHGLIAGLEPTISFLSNQDIYFKTSSIVKSDKTG